ncbi:hypothetical protein ABG79_00251 [Caloramator mitchellensis]|uniref:Uncharacterized protein n=1 Tax=Caloramator mitchellensis TaxID=908809 RepID=A0A0R3K3T8_CALMK|nr:hypothetical protein [Caloramator mitchellensis]KRQ88084.1 hypothetical protein ABG79_00251 [Caloramator mitchellensis]
MFSLTEKDKKMLSLLLIVIMAVMIYLMYQALNSKVELLKGKNIELNNRMEQLNQAVILYNANKDKIEDTKKNYFDLSSRMPTNQDEKFCIVDTLNLLKKHGAVITDIPISSRQEYALDEKKKDDKAFFYTIKINTVISYQKLKNLISRSEDFNILYNIDNLVITPIPSNANLACSFDLNFYGYRDEFAPIRQWEDFNLQTGKSNLFTGTSKSNSNLDRFTNEYIEKNKDFILLASTINSPTTAVTLSKMGEGFSLFGNNKSIESASIELKQNDNKIFYKISTETETYPKSGEYKEFKSQTDDIIIYVFSTPRKFEDDKNVVLLNIKNETNRRVFAYIFNDDKNNPRVRVVTNGKNTFVEKR